MIRWQAQGRGVGYKVLSVRRWHSDGGDRVMMMMVAVWVLGQACMFMLMVERLMVMGAVVA